MVTVAIPEELSARIQAAGREVSPFAVATIREKLESVESAENRPKTFGDLVAEGEDVFPSTVALTPRTDGRSWSEIEAACDSD